MGRLSYELSYGFMELKGREYTENVELL